MKFVRQVQLARGRVPGTSFVIDPLGLKGKETVENRFGAIYGRYSLLSGK
jgi:hypothetical protein